MAIEKKKAKAKASLSGRNKFMQKQMRQHYIRSVKRDAAKRSMGKSFKEAENPKLQDEKDSEKEESSERQYAQSRITDAGRKSSRIAGEKVSSAGRQSFVRKREKIRLVRSAKDAFIDAESAESSISEGVTRDYPKEMIKPGMIFRNGKNRTRRQTSRRIPDLRVQSAKAALWKRRSKEKLIQSNGIEMSGASDVLEIGEHRISGLITRMSMAVKAAIEELKTAKFAVSIAAGFGAVILVIMTVVLTFSLMMSKSFGEFNFELSDNDLVNIALSQVGTESGEDYCRWYGFDHEVGWCAIFTSWCAEEAGLIKADKLPKFAWVPSGVNWFQNRNQWEDNSYVPAPGVIIFFDWYDDTLDEDGEPIGQDGNPDHVGIVEKVENGMIYTVEGNTTADSIVAEKRYPVGYYEILGFGKII